MADDRAKYEGKRRGDIEGPIEGNYFANPMETRPVGQEERKIIGMRLHIQERQFVLVRH